jgi:hypothetical protein
MIREYIDIMIEVKENDLEALKREQQTFNESETLSEYHNAHMKGYLSGRIMEIEFILSTLKYLKNGK